jgi:non-ribosomal peptide synthetase component F
VFLLSFPSEYMTELYDAAMVRRLAGAYLALLSAAASAPYTPAIEVELATPDDERLLAAFVPGEMHPEYLSAPFTIHQFEDVAAAHPGRVALEFEGREMTYGEVGAGLKRWRAQHAAVSSLDAEIIVRELDVLVWGCACAGAVCGLCKGHPQKRAVRTEAGAEDDSNGGLDLHARLLACQLYKHPSVLFVASSSFPLTLFPPP